MSIHPPISKEGWNNSTSGFRSNRKLHQHEICQRITTPHQMITATPTSIQCRWNMKQEWRYWTLHQLGNADRKSESMVTILPHWSSWSKGHPRLPVVCCKPTKDWLGLRINRQYTVTTHTMYQESYRVMHRTMHDHSRWQKKTTSKDITHHQFYTCHAGINTHHTQ